MNNNALLLLKRTSETIFLHFKFQIGLILKIISEKKIVLYNKKKHASKNRK